MDNDEDSPVSRVLHMPMAIVFLALIVLVAGSSLYAINLNNSNNGHDPLPDTVIFSLTEPQVTEEQIISYLNKHGSGALKNYGKSIFTMGSFYNIDPAFAAAVAKKETYFGNVRCKDAPSKCNNFFCIDYDDIKSSDLVKGECGNSEWAEFETVEKGIEAFYYLIQEKYIGNNPSQDTVSKIACIEDVQFARNCYCDMTGTDCQEWVDEVLVYIENARKS